MNEYFCQQFSGLSRSDPIVKERGELDHRILALLSEQAEYHGVTCRQTLVADRFAELIREVWKQTGKSVVILVDEYDKPILDR